MDDLASLYRHLEDLWLDYEYSQRIGKLFEKIGNLTIERGNTEEAEQAQWEADFFFAHFERGDAKCIRFEKLDTREYDYLKRRLSSSRSPLLRARYAHILWCSRSERHADHAKIATDAYLDLLRAYEVKQIECPTAHHGLNLINAALNAHSLACQTHDSQREARAKAELKRLLIGFPYDNPRSLQVRRTLIRYMLDRGRKFSREDFDTIDDVCWQSAQQLISEGRQDLALDMLELGKIISKKLSKKSDQWMRRVGECHEVLMERYRNTPNEQYHWDSALEAYQEVKDGEKITSLEAMYWDVVSRTPVSVISVVDDVTEFVAHSMLLADRLAQESPGMVFEFLASDDHLLPRLNSLRKVIDGLVRRFDRGLMDQRGHQAQHAVTDSDKQNMDTLTQGQLHLKHYTAIKLREILRAAIGTGKISDTEMLKYLNEHSWLGKDIKRPLPGLRFKTYRWLDLVAPSITQCVSNLTAYFGDPSQPISYILGMDSLTLKLEGLIRDLCESHGIITWTTRRGPSGKHVRREKELGALLGDPKLKKVIADNDLLFLKLLLVEQAGFNLRNRVAHSLVMTASDYVPEYCMWLLLALLRVVKYPLGEKLEVV